MALRIYSNQTTFDAGLERMRWVFDEFPEVIASVSGGKDSTCIFYLALQVAREKNRLPLKVMFLDQEAEWESTIDTVRKIMEHPDVEPLWLQIPIKLFNATSSTDNWLMCWDPKEEHRWMRPREPYAITENTFGTDRFKELFDCYLKTMYKGKKVAYLVGMRGEESPNRLTALTNSHTYKGRTWGKHYKPREHYVFYPLYDWSYMDVWKAIHSNKWDYNPLYDQQYRYGLPIQDMRVSNVHHETAVKSLFYLQEVEPQTYQKLTQRIEGIDMAGKMGFDDYFPKKLPFMFTDWKEYRDHLLKYLIQEEWQASFKKRFADMDNTYSGTGEEQNLYKTQITSILTNDWEFVKLDNWNSRGPAITARKLKRGVDDAYTRAVRNNQKK